MFLGHKVRRRVSKRALAVSVLAGLSLYHLALVLYTRLTSPVRLELVNNVNVILHHHQDHHEEDKISDLGEEPQPEPVPEPETDELRQNIPHLQKPSGETPVKQNAKYMENILSKMEKSLNKDDLKLQNDLANLPDPAKMLLEQVGPVARVSLQNIPKQRKAKVIVIAREHSGYPVLGQFFTQDNDFFVHGEPPVKTETVLNLLNCVLAPEMVHNFSDLIQKDFGQTDYFRSSCLLDSDSVCSDPLSYENKCSTCPYQVLKSKHFSLTFAKDLMEAESDVRVVYLVRDPRGVLRHSQLKPQKVCGDMARDWTLALGLMAEFPDQFHLVRYEDVARAPVTEVTALLERWDIKEATEKIKGAAISPDLGEEETEDAWSLKRNPVTRVNSWKTGLTSSELKVIENSCSEALSKMEYQVIGAL